MTSLDIHKCEKKLGYTKRKVQNADIHPRNKELLLAFERACLAEGLGIHRRDKLLRHMLQVANDFLPIPFEQATKKDLQEAVALLEDRTDYSPHTRSDLKLAIRKFFKWLIYREEAPRRDGVPELVAWIRTSVRKRDRVRVRASDILTVEEVERMIEKTRNPRNRAFLALLYELGARIGELGGLRVGDVTRDEYSLIVDLDGKTGRRSVRVVLYAGYVVAWLNAHPDRHNPASALWPSLRPGTFLRPLPYRELRSWIKRAAWQAGIRKRVYPHLFRHSRATHLLAAGKLNETQAKTYFGWAPDSSVLSTYAHLVARDANDAILRMHGIQPQDDRASELEGRACGMCAVPNPSRAKYCHRCGYSLTMSAPEETETRKAKADELLSRFLQDPKVRDLFKKVVRDENGNDDNDAAPLPSGSRRPRPNGGADSDAHRPERAA